MSGRRLWLAIALASGAHVAGASAATWVQPIAQDQFWWVDRSSIIKDAQGFVHFKLHTGKDPDGEVVPMLNFTAEAAIDCRTGTQFEVGAGGTLASPTRDTQLSSALRTLVCGPDNPVDPGFIFADSDRRRLTENDLAGLSLDQIRIARNEIFARKGRYFKDDALRARFSGFAWYHPYAWDVPLNHIEAANVQFLLKRERRH